MTDDAPAFSRDTVLGGLPARRASTLLFAIENRTAVLVSRAKRAMATFETERTAADHEQSFLAALAGGRDGGRTLRIQDLDRHADGWADLLSPDPELRAAIIRRIEEKYGLPERARTLRRVMGFDDPAVSAAFERQTGRPLASVGLEPLPVRERLRWRRTETSRSLEDLPPFWLAFALTLTETVGGGILALPIAFAGFGPLGAAVVLVVFGIVNAMTVAALVESITRDGSMRYGDAFFGRLVGDYLGRPGTVVAMPALLLLDIVGILVCVVGFATTIGGAVGLPAVLCALPLFLVVLVVLWRGSFDATVALAVAIGTVNIALLVTITALAAGSADISKLGLVGPGLTLDAHVLELIFGVALVAYFGHTSAGHSAKVVLQRDPTGRHLMAGNVAAMLVAMVIYVIFVIVVTAAVGPANLAGYDGTALTPLAEKVGPVVDALGTVYVTLSLGLGAVYGSLGLYNLMAEVLAAGELARWRSVIDHHAAGFALRAAPLVAIFIVVELLLDAGDISFTEPTNVVGTITLPLLAGVFPMLIVVAARRRGERLPGRVIGLLGHPATAVVIGSLYLVSVVAFGLVIWEGPIQRIAALATASAIVALALVTWRRGAYAPRTVVEYRVEPGPPSRGIVSVLSGGRPLPSRIRIGETTGHLEVDGSEARINAPNRVRDVRVSLPHLAARELELWVHAITGDGASVPVTTAVHLSVAGDVSEFQLDGRTAEPVILPIRDEPAELTLSMTSVPSTS